MATEAYLLLAAVTALLLVLVWLIWLRTRSLGFVLGISLLYYWSLFGAWGLISDLGHAGEARRYQYLFAKMFGVDLDSDYVLALAYYGVFLIAIAGTVLLLTGRRQAAEGATAIRLSHGRLIASGFTCLFAAVWLIRGQLFEAVALGYSGYDVTAAGGAVSPLFSLHQAFNTFAILPVAVGIPVLLTAENGKFMVARRTVPVTIAYVVLVAVLFLYGMVMGNKAELFFGAIAGVVLYSLNALRPRWGRLVLAGLLAIASIGVIDYARTLAVSEMTTGLDARHVAEAVGDVARSNEAYAAHFSMYGVLHYKVPLTWGTSVVSLVASAVPRAFWADRPGTVYDHYSSYLGMTEGQGYTLHHAAGWYLNFGLAGILIGGMVLGGVWGGLYRGLRGSNRQWYALHPAYVAVAFAFFTGGLPNLVRVGLEGYKTVIAFGILFPMLMLVWARRRGAEQ